MKVDGLAVPILIKPGQFVTGRFAFHKAMYPKKKKINKSSSTVWRWLQTLEKLENLHIETNSRYSIVTIMNWGIYQQGSLDFEQVNEQPVNSRRTAGEQPVHTNKNVENGENGKKDTINGDARQSSFDSFWQLYPRRVGKAAALKSWAKINLESVPDILEAVRRQKTLDSWQRNNGQYIPHPATWLNNKRWEDELETVEEWQ